MLTEKDLETIAESVTEADALVETYLKKYFERRLSEETDVLKKRITELENFITSPAGKL